MKKLKQLSILSSSLYLILVLFACKKDKVPLPISDSDPNIYDVPCENFSYAEQNIILEDYYLDTQQTAPCFSPFTDDEFVYVRWVPNGSPAELVKYKISTKTEQVLCNLSQTVGISMGAPDWGRQGKIVFHVGTGGSGIGYMINDDGSNLHQFLPSNINTSRLRFNGNGTRILGGGALTNYYVPIRDLNANIVDSLSFRIESNNLNLGGPSQFYGNFNNALLAYADLNESPVENGIGYLTSDTSFHKIHSINPSSYQLTALGKYQNSVYYVLYGVGLYKFNETTGVKTLLQEMCDSRKIYSFSVSQISGNILIEEMNNKKASEVGGVIYNSNIYLLNPNTMVKTPILVD